MGNTSESAGFTDVLGNLLDRKGVSPESAARMADMSPAYGAGVIGGGRATSRDDIVRLALAIAANAASANRLLAAAGLARLDPGNARDRILADSLDSGRSLRRANIELSRAGERPLS